jgi:polysaccharide pyruvyl transferase WcaK-like protein
MGSAPKRIGLFGNFGTGNFGNDASLESMLLFLRQTQPDAELTCVCFNPEKVRHDHQIPALPAHLSGPLRKFTDWIHAVRTVRKFDVLIMPGTGILCDFCAPPSGMPYTLFRWCLAAKLCGTGIAFVSVGAGPIHHPISRWLIKRTASMARYRSYRNKFSKEFLKRLGVNTRQDPIYPDIAFRLPSPPNLAQQSPEVKPLTVGIGAMAYYGWRAHSRPDDKIYEEYLRNVTEFVLWLLDHDYRVRTLMGDELDQKAVDDLRKAVAAKRPLLPAGVLIAEPAHSGQEVMRQMIDTDLVISGRFHHLVFALMLGKLTISTGYTEYHKELLAEMGIGAFSQHSENIKVELLIGQFTELISNRSHYEAIIRNAATSARERLAHQDSVFTSQFLEAACHERSDSIRSGRRTPMSL